MQSQSKQWQFIEYKHGNHTYDAMYEYSGSCVSARLFLAGRGQWSNEKSTHHDEGEPLLTARMLLRELADDSI